MSINVSGELRTYPDGGVVECDHVYILSHGIYEDRVRLRVYINGEAVERILIAKDLQDAILNATRTGSR